MSRLDKNYIIILLNVVIAVCGIIGFMQLDEPLTLYTFRYYTYCSNFLAIFEGFIFAGALARIIKAKNKAKVSNASGAFKIEEYKISRFNYLFQYIVTIILTITMLIVLFVLMPMYGEGAVEHYLTGHFRSFVFHLLNPILSITSFILSKDLYTLKRRDIWIGFIPTVIYAIILLTLNTFKIVEGPYSFLKVYKQPIYMTAVWTVVILSVVLFLAYIYYKINVLKIGAPENEK